MNRSFKNALRFPRTNGVIFMLSAMLMFTSQGAFEEYSSETGSQEIELVFVRGQERNNERSDPVEIGSNPFLQTLKAAAKPLRNRFFSLSTERTNLNGLGTYLLV